MFLLWILLWLDLYYVPCYNTVQHPFCLHMGRGCCGEITHVTSYRMPDSITGPRVSFLAAVMRIFIPITKIFYSRYNSLFQVWPLGCEMGCFEPQLDASKIAGDHSFDVQWDVVMVQCFIKEGMGNYSIGISQNQPDNGQVVYASFDSGMCSRHPEKPGIPHFLDRGVDIPVLCHI